MKNVEKIQGSNPSQEEGTKQSTLIVEWWVWGTATVRKPRHPERTHHPAIKTTKKGICEHTNTKRKFTKI